VDGTDRIPCAMTRAGYAGRTPAQLVSAMEDAATVDLRADAVLPLALRVLGRPTDPVVGRAADELRAWIAGGAHRIDRDGDGRYEDAGAIALFDAWWPRWMHAADCGAAGFAPSRSRRRRWPATSAGSSFT